MNERDEGGAVDLIWFFNFYFYFFIFFRIWWLSRSPRLAQSVKGPPWPPPLPPAVIGLRESRSGEYSPHVIKFNRVSFCFLLSFVAIRRDDIVSTGLWVVVLFFFSFPILRCFRFTFCHGDTLDENDEHIDRETIATGWTLSELICGAREDHRRSPFFFFLFSKASQGSTKSSWWIGEIRRRKKGEQLMPLSSLDFNRGLFWWPKSLFFFAIFRQKRVALKGSSSFRSLYLLSLRWIDYQQNWGNQINKNTPKFDLEAVDRDQHSFMRLPLVLDWVLVGNCNIVWCRFWLDFDYLIASSLYHSRSTRNSRQDWVSSYFFSFLIEIFSILSKVTSK